MFYDVMTVTGACTVETVQAYLGVINRRGRTKVRFVAFVALIKRFEAKIRQVVRSSWPQALAKDA